MTINKSYLTSLATGDVVLTFDFYEGIGRELTVSVTDSTGEGSFDTFDGYAFADELNTVYSKNFSGNSVGLNLVTKNGSQALSFSYNVGNPNYCGVNKTMKNKDFATFLGIELWIEGDGSGNEVTIQFRDDNDHYWESYIKVAYKDQVEITTPYIRDSDLDYNVQQPTDLVTDVVFYGTTLKSITYNGTALAQGTDYSINGGQVRINQAFLKTLVEDGVYQLVYTFCDSTTAVLTITVTGSEIVSPVEEIVIDSFDNTNSSNYRRNENGNAISITSDGERAKVSYTVGNPAYAGFTKAFSGGMNWTTGKTMKLEVTSDTAGRDLVIQFKDKNGNYFEAKKTLSGGSNTVTVSLSEFKTPSWAQSATPNYSMITEYSIYIEKGTGLGTGTLYVDNLILK